MIGMKQKKRKSPEDQSMSWVFGGQPGEALLIRALYLETVETNRLLRQIHGIPEPVEPE